MCFAGTDPVRSKSNSLMVPFSNKFPFTACKINLATTRYLSCSQMRHASVHSWLSLPSQFCLHLHTTDFACARNSCPWSHLGVFGANSDGLLECRLCGIGFCRHRFFGFHASANYLGNLVSLAISSSFLIVTFLRTTCVCQDSNYVLVNTVRIQTHATPHTTCHIKRHTQNTQNTQDTHAHTHRHTHTDRQTDRQTDLNQNVRASMKVKGAAD